MTEHGGERLNVSGLQDGNVAAGRVVAYWARQEAGLFQPRPRNMRRMEGFTKRERESGGAHEKDVM
eukprot:9687924-Alexandrium_andersonii.AAC.1